jgi:hypothetical protein
MTAEATVGAPTCFFRHLLRSGISCCMKENVGLLNQKIEKFKKPNPKRNVKHRSELSKMTNMTLPVSHYATCGLEAILCQLLKA